MESPSHSSASRGPGPSPLACTLLQFGVREGKQGFARTVKYVYTSNTYMYIEKDLEPVST